MTTRITACRDALGVLLDAAGAHSDADIRRAQLHAARCPRCAVVLDDDEAADRVLANLRAHRPSPSTALRVILAVVATAQLVVAAPWLFGTSLVPHRDVAISHLTRDGALGLAIAVLGLLVVWRPRYAVTALIAGTAVLIAQSATSVFDEQGEAVPLVFEFTHLLVIGVLALVGVVATQRAPAPDTRRRPPPLRSL